VARLDDRILDAGLGLAMEWGDEWLRPIHERLARVHPELGPRELDAYDRACRAAMKYGNERAASCWHAANGDQAEAYRLFVEAVAAKYSWISEANLARLFSQGSYYAWKDGGPP
jgi:hypothetical protein